MDDQQRHAEVGLLCEWVAERDLTGQRIAVSGPPELHRALGERAMQLDPGGPDTDGVDVLLVVAMPVSQARPVWYSADWVRSGGRVVLVARLDPSENLGEAMARFRLEGSRVESFEELYEPGGRGGGLRFLRLVQRLPPVDSVVAR